LLTAAVLVPDAFHMAVDGTEEKIFLTKILQNYTLAPAKDTIPSIPGARSRP